MKKKYYRVDPAKSSGSDYYILDEATDLASLKGRDELSCLNGNHRKLRLIKLTESQHITCDETNSKIFTIIYETK
jgi:hypothetical protein